MKLGNNGCADFWVIYQPSIKTLKGIVHLRPDLGEAYALFYTCGCSTPERVAGNVVFAISL